MTIPPFLQQLLGVAIRAAIVWLAGYLAAHGLTLSDDQTTQVIAWVTPLLGALAWSVYQKFHGRQKLMTALVTPAGATEQQIEQHIRAGGAPSVLTAKTEVPS